jgi:N-acyl-D-aspartate/D-glutamate deacylase
MRRDHLPLAVSRAFLLFALFSGSVQAAKIDGQLLLKDGLIVDGSGGEPVVGNVAIDDDTIIAVGTFEIGKFDRVIDCRGLVVAPGFIDLHTHSDDEVIAPATRASVNYLVQGCTTAVTGNCGSGPVNVAAYLDKVDAAGAGTNVMHLLPQGSLRQAVMGTARREPTPDELAEMKRLADKAMAEGCWGMTSGLIYVPSVYATTDELVEIASVVGNRGGFYASHIRGEGSELLDAVREALDIGTRSGAPVHISHFKASGRNAWGSLHIAADLVEKARAGGQRVTADQYPYTASSTSLEASVIPTAAREGGRKALVQRLNEATPGTKLHEKIAAKVADAEDQLHIASYKPHRAWTGKSLAEIAKAEGRPAVDIVYEIERHGGARVVNFGMSEDDVRMAMRLPWVATASDGHAMIPGIDQPHPRSFGTFARKVGHYAIAENVLPLAAAIRSASGLPADILGVIGRGYLREGYSADVVVFDPKTFRDTATFDQPYRYAVGARYVLVNGSPAVFDGVPTGALAGKSLRMPARTGKRETASE